MKAARPKKKAQPSRAITLQAEFWPKAKKLSADFRKRGLNVPSNRAISSVLAFAGSAGHQDCQSLCLARWWRGDPVAGEPQSEVECFAYTFWRYPDFTTQLISNFNTWLRGAAARSRDPLAQVFSDPALSVKTHPEIMELLKERGHTFSLDAIQARWTRLIAAVAEYESDIAQ